MIQSTKAMDRESERQKDRKKNISDKTDLYQTQKNEISKAPQARDTYNRFTCIMYKFIRKISVQRDQ